MGIIEALAVVSEDAIIVDTRKPEQSKVKPTIYVPEFIEKLKRELEKMGVNHEEA